MTIVRRLLWAVLGSALFAMAGPSLSQSTTTVLQCDARTDPATKNEFCFVEVSPAPAGATCGDAQVTVNPDQITVLAPGGNRKKLQIRFQFKDEAAGYRFCPTLGDGAFLKLGNLAKHKQFVHMYGTDGDGDGNNPPTGEKDQDGCYKRFRFEFRNRFSNDVPESQYDYVLRFRQFDASEKQKVACIKDPWVKNGK